jgi:hypothetical protein
VEAKRCGYWKAKVATQTNPRELWRSINVVLCRQIAPPVDKKLTASDLADFFDSKVSGIRAATEGAPAAKYVDIAAPSGVARGAGRGNCSRAPKVRVRRKEPKQKNV